VARAGEGGVSRDLCRELGRWGVVFGPPRRVTLREVGYRTDGEYSDLRTVRCMRQIGATSDSLFQVDLAGDGGNLWKATFTGFVSANPTLTERNGLLLSIGLSTALPWWDGRVRWLIDGLHTLAEGRCSSVAWPGAFAVRLHQAPSPVNTVHLTIVYQGRRLVRG